MNLAYKMQVNQWTRKLNIELQYLTLIKLIYLVECEKFLQHWLVNTCEARLNLWFLY